MAGDRKLLPAWKIVAGTAATAAFLVLLFSCAGRLNWTRGWVFIALLATGQTLSSLIIWRKNPDLLIRRSQPGKGTKTWDIVLLSLFGISYLIVVGTAALDVRYAWTSMNSALWIVGFALYIFFIVLFTWAMAANPFFETTVRIQHDRNHRVIDSGPYQYVRHPGYTAAILGFIFSVPFLLGSWSAIIPAFISALFLIIRTVLEENTLRRELPGYENYMHKVRYRLVPMVW